MIKFGYLEKIDYALFLNRVGLLPEDFDLDSTSEHELMEMIRNNCLSIEFQMFLAEKEYETFSDEDADLMVGG